MAFYRRGNAYREQRQDDRAIADYTEAVRLAPNFKPAFGNRGIAYLTKGLYDRAIADFDQVIRLDPTDARAFHNRGAAYLFKGEYDRAIADFTAAIRLNPNYAFAFHNRGDAYFHKGQYDRAIADFDQAIRLIPDFALAFVNRGKAYLSQGQYDRAIADLDQAMRITPDSSFAALVYRGIAYFYKGNFAAAADSLLSANDLEDDGHVMLWRFLALGRMGQDGGAELSANAARLKTRQWPYPVIEFYLGRHTQNELRAAAGSSDEKCQAAFYVGEWAILHGNRSEGKTMLKTAADICTKSAVEYAGAVAELRRLKP